MSQHENQDSTLHQHFRIVEVSDGRFFADEIFKRKLGGTVPDYGRHVIAFYKHDWTDITPLGYQHVLPHNGVGLCGGGSVDGRAFTRISQEHCQQIYRAGGVLYQLLTYVFTQMADDYSAFFGYCGDKRAEEIDLKAGFKPTKYPLLLANFHKALSDYEKDDLIENIYSIGRF